MARALAHIEKIVAVEPIENADRLELVTVLGWKCVANKGEFRVGDLCIYHEIDSRVPIDKPVYEFMASNDGKVKTRKFRGQISQGLALSLDKFDVNLSKYKEGDDVTALLGVTKIVTDEEKRLAKEAEDPRVARVRIRYKKFLKSKLGKWIMKHKWTRNIFLRLFGGKKVKRKAWPDFISKTDETRIENMPWQLNDKQVLQVSEKLDGTSTTFFIKKKGKKYEFGVCSRNVRQLDDKQTCYHDSNVYWEMAHKYNIESVLKDLANQLDADYIVLQGETIGNVQGNPYKLDENRFYAFNLIVDGKKYDSVVGKDILAMFGIGWVPILQRDFVAPDTMEEMKALAEGMSVINPKVKREGCVYRNEANTVSFKNVSVSYLLKHGQ